MPRSKPPQNFYNQSRLLAQKTIVKPVTLSLPKAHSLQYDLITALDRIPGCRFVVGACGTKFGKTFGTAIALVSEAWRNKNTMNWWVAPTFSQSENAYNLVKRILPPDTFRDKKADLRLELLEPDGAYHSTIEFKSGDKPESLRGYAVNFFVMDEAALSKFESAESIMTTVMQTMGRGLFISTPKGQNWFYDWYKRGEKFDDSGLPKFAPGEEDPFSEWYSIRMPTWKNPHVKLEAIRQFKKNMPEDSFRQEVAALFLEDSAGVFRNIKDCIRGVLQEYTPGHRYVMGVDLARLKDYTVLTVMDASNNHVVYFERFNKISWELQYQKIIQTARTYRAQAVMDSTGIGDPIVSTIQSAGISVFPYKIGGTTAKQQLIEKLKISIEQQKISFPDIPVLRRELSSYEYKTSESGAVRYSAPGGMHDDTVISLALANWVCAQDPWVYRYSNKRI